MLGVVNLRAYPGADKGNQAIITLVRLVLVFSGALQHLESCLDCEHGF